MDFGEYLKTLRMSRDLSQRELCAKTNGRVSNAEISRLESGDRIKPSPAVLKAIAPHLGVSYQELMIKAGYIEEMEEEGGVTTAMYYDSEGNMVDLIRTAKEIQARDPDLLRIVSRMAGDLDRRELSTMKDLMERLTDGSMSETEKQKLHTLLELFLKQ